MLFPVRVNKIFESGEKSGDVINVEIYKVWEEN